MGKFTDFLVDGVKQLRMAIHGKNRLDVGPLDSRERCYPCH